MLKTKVLVSFLIVTAGQQVFAQHVPDDDDAQIISGEMAVGLGLLSNDSYRYGRYTGVIDQGPVALFSLRLQTQPVWESDDPRYAWFDINYVGPEFITARSEIGIVGRGKAALEFRKLSNFLFQETSTPFIGGNALNLPGNWQANGSTTQDFVNLNSDLASASLQTQRDRWQFQFENIFLSSGLIDNGWSVNIAYRQETKDGRRALAGTIGTNAGNARAALMATPVDFENNIFELQLQKNAAQYHYGIYYSGSYFTNEVESISWQNPFGNVTQWAGGVAYPDGAGQLAQEPDSTAQQVGINAGWYFSRSSLHLDASRGIMTQNHDFLPYTVNPNLTATVSLPADDLDGEIDTTYINLRYVLHPTSKLNLIAHYRMDDRDNQTPQYTFFPVTGDATNQGGVNQARINRPYSYTQRIFSLNGNYRLSRGLQVKLGASRDDKDHSFSEVNKTEETTLETGLTVNRWQTVNLSINVAHSDRDSDEYIGNRPLLATHIPGTVASTDFENHPQLRKYYLSDRQRRQVQVRADWFANSATSLGISTAYNQDKYNEDFFGLQKATMFTVAVDASYEFSSRLSLTTFLSRDHYDTEQAGRSFTAAPGQYLDTTRNWNVASDDLFDNAGFTLAWKDLPLSIAVLPEAWQDRVDTGLELAYSRSQTDIDTSTGPALTLTPLPDIETRLKSYRWFVRWYMPSDARLDFALTHESYHTDDFAYTNVGPTTIANVLTLGELNPRYSVNWFTFTYALPF